MRVSDFFIRYLPSLGERVSIRIATDAFVHAGIEFAGLDNDETDFSGEIVSVSASSACISDRLDLVLMCIARVPVIATTAVSEIGDD
jgi:hypothetical protein